MTWKLFWSAFVSSLLISFPQNIIGCGPDIDPYDYYVSFFQVDPNQPPGYRPFYYTGYRLFYDDVEPTNAADVHAQEWASYAGGKATAADAQAVIFANTAPALQQLAALIQAKNTSKSVALFKQNSFAKQLQANLDLEAVKYLQFAKRAEKVADFESGDYWNPPTRNKATMAKLIQDAQAGFKVAKKPFIKQRWGYQVLRLHFYNEQYQQVLRGFDQYTAGLATSNSVIHPLTLSLKAGALYKTKKSNEAAYLFSRAFALSPVKRLSNYLGFIWSIDRDQPRDNYLKRCTTNSERAAMLSLFAMSSIGDEAATIKQVYREAPEHELLSLLISREINKLEESFFTPKMRKQPGGNSFFYSWMEEEQNDSLLQTKEVQTRALSSALLALAKERGPQAALLQTSAAYLAYLVGDYAEAANRIEVAEQLKPMGEVKDQLELTRLLTTISRYTVIDDDAERALEPAVRWLYEKASREQSDSINYYSRSPWRKMYRDLMSEVLSRRYHTQGDIEKEMICIGSGEAIMNQGDYDYYNSTLDQVRKRLTAAQAIQLHQILSSEPRNPLLKFLLTHNRLNGGRVAEFVGTAHLREQKYTDAIAWYKKCNPQELAVNTDPFSDELYDYVWIPENSPRAKRCTSKLQYAETMLKLSTEAAAPNAPAETHYQYALGLYNATYYGPAWMLLDYYRSSVDGYNITNNSSLFQMNYYGAIPAEAQFARAMGSSTDPEFKARCLFMMAKSAQKQFKRPSYQEFGYNNWDKYEQAEKIFYEQFAKNPHFPRLKEEFGQTKFYQQAVNWCAYLADYAQKK